MHESIAEEIPAEGAGPLSHRVVRQTAPQVALRDHLESVVEDLDAGSPGESEYGILVGVYQRN